MRTSAATVAGTGPPKRQRASDGAPVALNGPETFSRPSRCSIGPRLALVPLGRPKGSGYGEGLANLTLTATLIVTQTLTLTQILTPTLTVTLT